jgi:hypothetical protein
MLSCSIWFSAPSFWMGGGLDSRCVGRVCDADGAVLLNIQCSWWWAYVPETYRAKNTSIKLPCCIKLAFQIISWGRCTVKQPSGFMTFREIIAVFCKNRIIYGTFKHQCRVTRTDVTTRKQTRRNQILKTPKGFQAYRTITLPSLRVLTFPSDVVHYAHSQKELVVSCPFG